MNTSVMHFQADPTEAVLAEPVLVSETDVTVSPLTRPEGVKPVGVTVWP